MSSLIVLSLGGGVGGGGLNLAVKQGALEQSAVERRAQGEATPT